jgi:hypothetical protein
MHVIDVLCERQWIKGKCSLAVVQTWYSFFFAHLLQITHVG